MISATRSFLSTASIAGLIVAAGLGAVPVFAQTAAAGAPDTSGDIIVTAERRTQNLQDVPASITAFDSASLRDLRVTQVSDLTRLTPGFAVRVSGSTSDAQFTVRGIGMNNSETNQNPAVTTYLDEIALPSNAMLGVQLFDLERVEVLKGPQGTFYGRNTTGGAVNLITKRPTRELSVDARLDLGSLWLREAEIGIGGPLTSTLAGRIAVNSYQRHGWQKLIVSGPRHGDFDTRNGDMDRQAVRASLLWEPSSVFSALLVGDYSHTNDDAMAYQHTGNLLNDGSRAFCDYVTTGIRDEANCSSYAIPRTGPGGTPLGGVEIFSDTQDDPRTAYASFVYGNQNDVDTGGFSLKLNADLGPVVLTSVTGYRKYKRISTADDGSPYALSDNYRDQRMSVFQQELRAGSGEGWGPVSWIAGVYYTRDTNDDFVLFDQSDQFAYSAEFVSTYRQVTEALAAFAQVDWKLTDTLTLTAGGRYTGEHKTFNYDGSVIGSGAFPVPVSGYSNRINAEKVTWRTVLKYEPTSDINLYASVSTGFKGGGFPGTIAFSAGQLTPFAPETITAYEAGVKAALFDRKVRVNAAFYYYDWKDFQATTQVNVSGVPLVILGTAGDARIYGVEGDISWYPVPELSLRGNFNWNDAKIKNGRYDGQIPPNTPDISASGIARWEPTGLFGSITPYVQTDVSYVSSTFVALANAPTVKEAKAFFANARIGLKRDDGIEVAAWVRNLTDKLYRTSILGSGSASLPARATFNDPRTWGFSIGYHF